MAQINQSFGSGGMTSGLDASQLIDFFQYLQRSVEGRLPIKKAVVCSGMQPDGSCVINKNVFLSSAGDLINSEKSQYLWLDKELLSENDKIRSVDISPNILLPLSTEPLEDLVATLEIISKHNFHSTLAVMTGAIMAFHFCTIKDLFGGCPIVVAMGPSETGKSTAIRAALALFGMQKISRYVKGTNALFMERASCSTFPFGIEEAVSSKKGKLKLDLTELVIDLYDGAISANMKTGSLTPKCVPVLATNFDVEDMDRLKSRILAVPFNSPSTGPTTEEEEAGYECFENSLRRNFFSSVIGWIVSLRQKLVQSKDEIQTTKLELVDGRGKTRNITGWSILLFFLKKLTSIVKRPDLFEAVKASILDFNSPLTSQQPTSSLSNPQDLVIQFCENIFKVATSITLQQRLEFMRTETEVDNKHVLAIWMKGAAPYFENNDNQVNIVPAVRKSQMGKLSVKREFLIPGRKDSCILKCFSVRRSCITIFLDSLPVQLARNLQQITKQDKSNQKKERPKNSTSLAGPEHSVKPKSSETASNASSSDNPEQGDKPKSSETASNASSSDDPEQGDKPKSSETTCNASSSDDREQGIKPESSEIASNASSSDDPEQGDKPKTKTASNTSGPEQGVKPYDGSECLRNPSSSTFTTATTSESISVLSDSNPSRKQPSRLINNSKGKTPRMPTRNSTKKRKSMNKSRANEEELPPSKRACK